MPVVSCHVIAYADQMIIAGQAFAAMPSKVHWEHFHHEADIGVRGFGGTMAEAFEQAALAMTAVIAEPATVIARDEVQVSVTAAEEDFLLYEWLNGLVYEMATRKMLFSHFQARIDDGELHGTARGEPIDIPRHQPTVEIKGATFTELAVRQRDDGTWLAQCVVDV